MTAKVESKRAPKAAAKFILVPLRGNHEISIESLFPSRDELMDAGRLIGNGRLYTEPNDGLETALNVFIWETQARRKYGNLTFSREKATHFSELLTAAGLELKEARESLDENRMITAVTEYNTLNMVCNPEQAIQRIRAEMHYREMVL